MAKTPDRFCECCQAEWYDSQISERNHEASMWRCPACAEWAYMGALEDDEMLEGGPPSELSERDRNVIVAALHFFSLRFRGTPNSTQLLGIYELAAANDGLPTKEEINDLCERIHPACSLVT